MPELEGQEEIPLGTQPKPRGRVPVPVPETRHTWQRYSSTNPVGCDVCRQAQVDDPTAPYAPRARYRLVWGDGKQRRDELLCVPHADERRAQLRLPRLQ